MGQIVSSAAKPKRCNANQLSQVPTPAAGEYILVSSDNSMNAAGQGYFDAYIVGEGNKAATALPLHKFKAEELEDELTQLEQEVNGIPPYDVTADISLTAGYRTPNDFEMLVDMKSGKGYVITVGGIGTLLSQIVLYFLNGEGAKISYYAFNDSYNPRTITLSQDCKKITVYASSAQVTGTGTATITIQRYDDVTIGLKGKVEDLEDDIERLDGRIDDENDAIILLGREINGYSNEFNYDDSYQATIGTSINTKRNPKTFECKIGTYEVAVSTGIASTISLYFTFTDDTSSNWTFNDANGFVRDITFDKDVKAIGIYVADSSITTSGTIFINIHKDATISKEGLRTKDEELEDGISKLRGYNEDYFLIREKIKEDKPYFIDDDWENVQSFQNASALDVAIARVPKGKHFLFVTDSHIDYGNSHFSELGETLIMDYVKHKVGAEFVAFGGDAIGTQASKYSALQVLNAYHTEKFAAWGDAYIPVQGNHDSNYLYSKDGTSTIPDYEIAKSCANLQMRYGRAVYDEKGIAIAKQMALTDDAKKNLIAWLHFFYYIDDNKNKIRFIVLETGNGGATAGLHGLFASAGFYTNGFAELRFVADSLLTTPDDYDVVVLFHAMFTGSTGGGNVVLDGNNSNDTTLRAPQALFAMLTAYRSGSSVQINPFYTSSSVVKELWKRGSSSSVISFDFSQAGGSKRVFLLGGDIHFDDAYYIWEHEGRMWEGVECFSELSADASSLLMVITDRANINHAGTESANYPYSSVAPNNEDVTRLGTYNEVLFDVITITEDNKVVCTRIGAGNDREFYIRPQ